MKVVGKQDVEDGVGCGVEVVGGGTNELGEDKLDSERVT